MDGMADFESVGRGSIPRRGAERNCPRSVVDLARDSAKVEAWVRFPARALKQLTLEPDGTAAACKAAFSGFDSHRRLLQARFRCRLNQRRPVHPDGFGSVRSGHGL